MATTQPLNLDLSAPESSTLPIYHRLGLLNGLLIGLALATGAWGIEAIRVFRLPVRLYLPTLILGMVVVTLLGAFVGWLTSRIAKTAITVPLWLVVAVITVLIINYLSYYGRTFIVWLADPRFWGRDVYPYEISSMISGVIVGGFLIYVVVGMLALLQGYRLENMVGNLGGKTRLNRSAWFSLLWPLPFVFLAAYFTRSSLFDPAAIAASVTNNAIETVQTYEGDLTQLGIQEGVNYDALRGVQDQIQGPYSLNLAEISPANTSVTVTANFDNGSWIYCRLINDQLSHCFDASPVYTVGLQSLLTGQPVPEDCRGCVPRFEDESLPDQLLALGQELGGSVTVEREAQWGGHVLMRATGANGQVAECWFEGITRTYLTDCTLVESTQ
ncbi:MAG: hypothetical protein R3C44_19840 [Chloroflexota bacterium]